MANMTGERRARTAWQVAGQVVGAAGGVLGFATRVLVWAAGWAVGTVIAAMIAGLAIWIITPEGWLGYGVAAVALGIVGAFPGLLQGAIQAAALKRGTYNPLVYLAWSAGTGTGMMVALPAVSLSAWWLARSVDGTGGQVSALAAGSLIYGAVMGRMQTVSLAEAGVRGTWLYVLVSALVAIVLVPLIAVGVWLSTEYQIGGCLTGLALPGLVYALACVGTLDWLVSRHVRALSEISPFYPGV